MKEGIIKNVTSIGDRIDTACGMLGSSAMTEESHPCHAIDAGDPTVGKYGDVSACSPHDQLAFVQNSVYRATKDHGGTCHFDGAGALQSKQAQGDPLELCRPLLGEVANEGVVDIMLSRESLSAAGAFLALLFIFAL